MKTTLTIIFFGMFSFFNNETLVVGRACHEIAKSYAESTGAEGAEWAIAYFDTYNDCEAIDELEEEIID